ncbi:SprT family zinc-dependent metalloprotease [uncultured Shewanella sp.]|uniref:SprT family zinc-dependent metalloprotease n=1 Tax=uncultured Shewanella sp. TaxID=173975 RepID=UPI00260537C9|nr:SprT family zinc-dependent metalloprotease [uncultured Shewanella sp.]
MMKILQSILKKTQQQVHQSIAPIPPSLMPASGVLSPLQQSIIDRVEACYQQAERLLDLHFPRASIGFKLRGKCAGMAHLHHNHLRFNPKLLANNSDAFLNEVVPHEVCHLLVYQLFGKVKPHGKEWQHMMQHLFSLTPRTTHDFDISGSTERQFLYQCHCGTVKLSLRRHNKVVRGQTQYRCRRCKIQLSPLLQDQCHPLTRNN